MAISRTLELSVDQVCSACEALHVLCIESAEVIII